MAASPLVDIVMASALIKATMPQQFRELCDAVRALEAQAIVEMAGGELPHETFRAQGKFKFIQQFRKHLVECSELRETYVRRDSNARSSTA